MLTEDLTAGSVKTTDVKKRQLAAESITYNFKKEAQFKEHFAAYFEMIGLDPVTKKAVVKEESKQEESKSARSGPQAAFEEALALSEHGKEFQQSMTVPELDNFLAEARGNGQHVVILDWKSKLSGEGAMSEQH